MLTDHREVQVALSKLDPGTGPDFKSQVLGAINIVELIGQTVRLKKVGRNFVGLCPFHQEKSPSFSVNPAKGFFHCFGCKASGNAIDFVMKRDRVEFLDAMRTLGQVAGIEMPRYGVSKEKLSERTALQEAHVAAVTFFENFLADPETGKAAREYLAKRGFTAETLKKFRVGLAVDAWDALLRSPVARKFPPPLLATAGLLKTRENNSGFYDTFRNRIMFPIRDESGRTIAFGGRQGPGSSDPPKYLNSPETPLFSKSRCVYGLDMARQKILESRTVAVVEGYTDVMMAHQFGVSNVVSILGTAMTEQHVQLLRRFADKIVLLFDADTAGDLAVDRVVELFLTQPVEIAIAAMPQGMDPDEYLVAHGAAAFEGVLRAASDVLTYKWKALARHFTSNPNDLTGQQKAVQQYLELLADARGSGPVDSLRWGAALTRVSRLTEIPIDELNRRFKMVRPARPAANRPAAPRETYPASANEAQDEAPIEPTKDTSAIKRKRGPLTARDRAERWILGILLVEPHRWHDVQVGVHLEDFTDAHHRRIAEVYWAHQRDEGEPVFKEFLGLLRDPDLTELAVELVEEIEGLGKQAEDPNATLDPMLADAVAYLTQAGQVQEEQKLLATLRRTSEENTSEQDELSLFEALVKNNQSTNLHRLGPVKRAR